MKCSSPPRRSTGLPQRKARPKPVNRKRKASEFARCYGSKERVAWVKRQNCAVGSAACCGEIHNAHAFGDGTSRRADAEFILPMCDYHHRQMHYRGAMTFETMYNMNLYAASQRTNARWLAHLASGAQQD